MEFKLVPFIIGIGLTTLNLVSSLIILAWTKHVLGIFLGINKGSLSFDNFGAKANYEELQRSMQSGVFFMFLFAFVAGFCFTLIGAVGAWPIGFSLWSLFTLCSIAFMPKPWRYTIPSKNVKANLAKAFGDERQEQGTRE